MVFAGGRAVRTPLAQTTESLQTNSKQATQLTITNLTDHKPCVICGKSNQPSQPTHETHNVRSKSPIAGTQQQA